MTAPTPPPNPLPSTATAGRAAHPNGSKARRSWRRTAGRHVAAYVAGLRLAGERVDATSVRELVTTRARRDGYSLEDVDAVMRAADLRSTVDVSLPPDAVDAIARSCTGVC